jgi:hypothetical protein
MGPGPGGSTVKRQKKTPAVGRGRPPPVPGRFCYVTFSMTFVAFHNFVLILLTALIFVCGLCF